MADEAVTHRPQTTTNARTQSQQSVLIGIENKHFIWKNILFLQTETGIGILPMPVFLFIACRILCQTTLAGILSARDMRKSAAMFSGENRTITEDELYNNEKGNEGSRWIA